MYGGIRKENLHHPYFSKAQEYIDLNWEMFNMLGYVETSKGKRINKVNHDKLTRQQLFNYLIQAYETETNMEIVKELDEYLTDKKTNLVLYVYDSFLFDFDKADGKDVLHKVKEIVSRKYPVKIKTGSNYDVLGAL
jgi:hypothetical protein